MFQFKKQMTRVSFRKTNDKCFNRIHQWHVFQLKRPQWHVLQFKKQMTCVSIKDLNDTCFK